MQEAISVTTTSGAERSSTVRAPDPNRAPPAPTTTALPPTGPDGELLAASAEFRRLHDALDACDFEAEADTLREEAAVA